MKRAYQLQQELETSYPAGAGGRVAAGLEARASSGGFAGARRGRAHVADRVPGKRAGARKRREGRFTRPQRLGPGACARGVKLAEVGREASGPPAQMY